MGERAGVSESEFHMWRAVLAFSLVDNVLSLEEQHMLRTYFSNVPFSMTQKKALESDLAHPPNVETMYKQITEKAHKERFCALARALSWCEGDMDRQEKIILQRLGCVKGTPDEDILRQSRFSPYLDDFHEHYARAGMIGLMKASPRFETRV